MSDRVYLVLVCALISAISVLGVLTFQAFSDRGVAHAQTAMSSSDMVAVTGSVGSGTSVLYVIDTQKKSLAVYRARVSRGGSIQFVGARRIKYDFELRSYHDASPKGYSVTELGKKYRESKEKDDKKGGNRRRR